MPAGYSKILASEIPYFKLVIFDKIGHSFAIAAVDKANDVIPDFLIHHNGTAFNEEYLPSCPLQHMRSS
jgi:hypothetical protein